MDTQDVDQDYEDFLKALAKQIKRMRNERGLTLRDMVVVHGYHDSQWRRMERDGAQDRRADGLRIVHASLEHPGRLLR